MLLQTNKLSKTYLLKRGSFAQSQEITALDNVTIEIDKNETIGVVGESGCGKTTLGKILMKLVEPTSGSAFWKGKDLFKLNNKEYNLFRKKMQIVFQDPFSSLDPSWKIKSIIGEGLKYLHKSITKNDYNQKIEEVMNLVGLSGSKKNTYPHEFSGGQRQRIAIARAIILEPEFIVCDEIVSALDVSIQSKIINLLKELKDRLNLTFLFISHNIKLTNMVSDKIFVMYLGQVVESFSGKNILKEAKHPYTKILLESVPELHKKFVFTKSRPIEPNIDNLKGCKFFNRCEHRQNKCKQEQPAMIKLDAKHHVACHLYN